MKSGTPALAALRAAGIEFVLHEFEHDPGEQPVVAA